MPCSLTSEDPKDLNVFEQTLSILDRSNTVAKTPLVSDQVLTETRRGERALFHVRDQHSSTPLGIVVLGKQELDLIIDPAARNQGFGSSALRTIVESTSGDLKVWVHGNNPSAEKLLQGAGFSPVRTLVRMHRRLPERAEAQEVPLPEGFSIGQFQREDIDEWVALNARIFAEHPEQGRISRQDVLSRMAEEWFREEHFLMLRDKTGHLVGYCWLKCVDGDGEIYVIGVAPELAGRGLGGSLFDTAQHHMSADPALTHSTLYVEGENQAAISLYESRGYTEALRSTQWMLSR